MADATAGPATAAAAIPPAWERILLRGEVEEFLHHEAALLDEWRLEEWLGLFSEDGRYLVPATDAPDADPRTGVTIVNDDLDRLGGRVQRLRSRAAHREFPLSRVRHLVTNVRLVDDNGGESPGPGSGTGAAPDEVRVRASFAVFRFRARATDTFVGSYLYALTRRDGQLRIREKVARLDMEELPFGTVSVIL